MEYQVAEVSRTGLGDQLRELVSGSPGARWSGAELFGLVPLLSVVSYRIVWGREDQIFQRAKTSGSRDDDIKEPPAITPSQ